jgi:hypothetical protein
MKEDSTLWLNAYATITDGVEWVFHNIYSDPEKRYIRIESAPNYYLLYCKSRSKSQLQYAYDSHTIKGIIDEWFACKLVNNGDFQKLPGEGVTVQWHGDMPYGC